MRATMCRRSAGFTMIELLVVLVIVGCLTAIAAVRLSGTAQSARLTWTYDRVIAADASLRQHALNYSQPGHLRFVLGTGELWRTYGDRRDASPLADFGAITVVRFVSPTRDLTSGEVWVDYSAHGTSETFAIELKTARQRSMWMLFAGVTGQVLRTEDEKDVENVFQAIRPGGPDSR